MYYSFLTFVLFWKFKKKYSFVLLLKFYTLVLLFGIFLPYESYQPSLVNCVNCVNCVLLSSIPSNYGGQIKCNFSHLRVMVLENFSNQSNLSAISVSEK